MDKEFSEDDGMDPGLRESASGYDGSEYDLGGFGERIGDDTQEDAESVMPVETPEDAFGEDDKLTND